MMKAVLLTLLVSSASAFAPQAQPQQSSVVRPATAELTGLVGVDLETGKKIVSTYSGCGCCCQ